MITQLIAYVMNVRTVAGRAGHGGNGRATWRPPLTSSRPGPGRAELMERLVKRRAGLVL